jgi:hypothetical protein
VVSLVRSLTRKHPQVCGSVVLFAVIDMVNDFKPSQWSLENGLRDLAVHEDFLSVSFHGPVAATIDAAVFSAGFTHGSNATGGAAPAANSCRADAKLLGNLSGVHPVPVHFDGPALHIVCAALSLAVCANTTGGVAPAVNSCLADSESGSDITRTVALTVHLNRLFLDAGVSH